MDAWYKKDFVFVCVCVCVHMYASVQLCGTHNNAPVIIFFFLFPESIHNYSVANGLQE